MTGLLFSLFVLVNAFTYWLRHINLRHMQQHGSVIPPGFEGLISKETLARSTAYTLDSSRLGLWESLFDNTLVVLFLFAGLLAHFDRLVLSLSGSFIFQGILFFLLLTWGQTILELPFSLYGTFVVEAHYGFNTMTLRLWLGDLIKTQTIGALLLGLIVAVTFLLVQWSPEQWWLWVWGFMALFSLFMMFVSPYIIEPLFNRFEPVTDEELRGEIETMMARAGLRVSRVMQMDASKRSRHSNAYFTGIGRVKRIALFDTLLQQMSPAEIVAVLAHEIGHWKLRHVLRRLLVVEVSLLVGSWISFQLLQWQGLPGLLGYGELSFPGRLVIVGFIASLAMVPVTPLSSWLSRRDEYAADRYACKITGNPEALASALIKLSAENLSNLHPHPLYARFYYSHPPVLERILALKSIDRNR